MVLADKDKMRLIKIGLSSKRVDDPVQANSG